MPFEHNVLGREPVFHPRAQPMLGVKAGGVFNRVQYSEESYLNDNGYALQPHFGYVAGMMFHYRVSRYWGLHAEVNYSRKGRILRRKGTDFVYDEWRLDYVSLPILFRYYFGNNNIKGYVNAGPIVSYVVNNEGLFTSSALLRNGGTNEIRYVLGERGDSEEINEEEFLLDIPNYQRFQWGLDMGIGIALPVFDQGKILFFDVRYSLLQSHIGRNSDNDEDHTNAFPGFINNFEGSIHTISVSLGIVFAFQPIVL